MNWLKGMDKTTERGQAPRGEMSLHHLDHGHRLPYPQYFQLSDSL